MTNDLLPLLGNLAFLDEMYARYRADASSVDASWRYLFENGTFPPQAAVATPVVTPARVPRPDGRRAAAPGQLDLSSKAAALVHAFRAQGHLIADLDPLAMPTAEPHPELEPETYGLAEEDLDEVVTAGGLHGIVGQAPLRDIIARMRETYCGHIGVEYMHISTLARRRWLAERMERSRGRLELDDATQRRVLEKLAAAEAFERFLHTKYVGTKRFSLEGSEMLIPLLDLALEEAGRAGVEDVVLGMAHRGRLNVLANIVGKAAHEIFAEFEDVAPESVLGSGDVKYHLGFDARHVTRDGAAIHLSLTHNPSHLEAVDPVAVGRVRARQMRLGDHTHQRALGILIHGDAAFAAQGIVAETLNLANLPGYRTGGTLHVIVNNQIGFTTTPQEARSSRYATDIAKMIECPIFHVNGEDAEAVALAVRLALEYRRTFHTDAVIDLLGFRKYGHNEADEPSFTQPAMYERIRRKPSAFKIWSARLAERGVVPAEEAAAMVARVSADLERELAVARRLDHRPAAPALGPQWQGYLGGADADVPDPDTGVPAGDLAGIARRITTLPDGFTAHPKVLRLLAGRAAMGRGETPLDWGMGEALAFGSLVAEGTLVRLSGQDVGRGTFSHRHAVVVDVKTSAEYFPLANVSPGQAPFGVFDSPLSEAAVLGFEYGFSLDYPEGLVIWEAQFGDFVNGAQTIIDEFLTSAEEKWKRLSGLVLLLPHGLEGQGPDHSSARFERFLQAAAEDSIQVAVPTTPAQIFHLLRRQARRPWRKPLVVMTPKSLLRHPAATSRIEDLARGRFRRVLPDEAVPAGEVDRLILGAGKVHFELVEERDERDDRRTAVARLEQLYPWPEADLTALVASHPRLAEVRWVQEEPANMGALGFVEGRLRRLVEGAGRRFSAIARPESASPATGSSKAHAIEQRVLLERALAR